MPLSSDCIQDKEKKPFGFFCDECEIYDKTQDCFIDHNLVKIEPEYLQLHCRPNRCHICDRELKRWIREQEGIKQIKKQFNWSRHRFIKFATLGLPGNKNFPVNLADNEVKKFREELVAKFKLLRRTATWKKAVDGGKWYFEVTTRSHLEQMHINTDEKSVVKVKLNPHLHILFMGPEKMDYDEIQLECTRLQLGKFHFSKQKPGSKFQNAIKYISAYLKKDNQFQGVNRGTFGFLQGNKKCQK